MDDLESLVLAAQAGQLDAFGQLVGRFQDMAFGAAMARLSDHHLAEDAAQSAFKDAFANLAQLKDAQAFPGWFRQIVYRHSSRAAMRRRTPGLPLEKVAETVGGGPSPVEAAQSEEMNQHLHNALARLPVRQRLTVVLYYIREYTVGDVAKFLDLPQTTVKKRLHDARRKLKDDLRQLLRDDLRRHRPSSRPGFINAVRKHVAGKRINSISNSQESSDPKEASTVGPQITITKCEKQIKTESKLGKSQLQGLWVAYKADASDAIRNQLVECYLPLVQFHAKRLATRLPSMVELDDLMCAGVFGLMDAIGSFDLDRGIKFETYSANRIRGAILDDLRSQDWVPRLVRNRTAKITEARRTIEAATGRGATDAELADHMQVNRDEFAKIRKDGNAVKLVSLDQPWRATDSEGKPWDAGMMKDPSQPNPASIIERLSIKQALLKGMSRAERLIVILYYYEQMTMKEIGLVLDLSESRVSQMHKSIMAQLKARHSSLKKPSTSSVA